MKRRTFIIGSLSAAGALAASKVRPAKIADVKKYNSAQNPKIDACYLTVHLLTHSRKDLYSDELYKRLII
ncbi:MAG: hypothetical protein GY850_30580 [bacterium]|nr:hypothetical protein [bacterium]